MSDRGVFPRNIKGFRDISPELGRLRWRIIEAAGEVYRRYGFEHWDTPALEYAECLGKYLPDRDTVEEGVYSFRNPELEPVLRANGRELRDSSGAVVMDHHHLTLRYDLTAPLARLYAENLCKAGQKQQIKQPHMAPLFRRYQFGPVYRYEIKLTPGRYREFWQLDFDTVGAGNVDADSEACCILADAMEAVGLKRGTYQVQTSHRKLFQGLFEAAEISGDTEFENGIIRIIDKYHKIGLGGVLAELGEGRTDEQSGVKIVGLGLSSEARDEVERFLLSCAEVQERGEVLERLEKMVGHTPSGSQGLADLKQMHELLSALDYDEERVIFDPTLARGMAYYTGPVFEVASKAEYRDEKGNVRAFGSICGGGRYDGLVERLLGLRIPATGAAIGVDRLVELISKQEQGQHTFGPVLVAVLDRSLVAEYHRLARELRASGIPAEVYLGARKKLKAQFSYADSRNCPAVVMVGSNELEAGTVSIKDLALGKKLSQQVEGREEWKKERPGQIEVPRTEMVSNIRAIIEG